MGGCYPERCSADVGYCKDDGELKKRRLEATSIGGQVLLKLELF